MEVEMELSRILISEYGGEQYIFLREKHGPRTFPIVIGITEALAIRRRLNDEQTLRPMTHDLLANVIEHLGGTVERIVINDLRRLNPDDIGQTFIATLYIRQNGNLVEVDSRPSDAIALGVALKTPIFVADHVIEEVLKQSSSPQAKIELLRQRLEMLSERISALTERLEDSDFVEQTHPSAVAKMRRDLEEAQAEYEAIHRVLDALQ